MPSWIIFEAKDFNVEVPLNQTSGDLDLPKQPEFLPVPPSDSLSRPSTWEVNIGSEGI